MGSSLPAFPFTREVAYFPASENSRLRNEAPITKVQLYDGKTCWLATRHDDIKEALSSDKLSADRRKPGYPEIHALSYNADEAKMTFVNLDEPAHGVQRSMIQSHFTAEAVEKLKPRMQAVVNRVLDHLVAKHGGKNDTFDLIEEFARPIPTLIIYGMLGIPDEDAGALSKDSSVRASTSRDAAEDSNERLRQYVAALVEKRIVNPEDDDVISTLVKNYYRAGKLEKDDLENLAFLVLTAGNAALTNSIGLGVVTLLRNPDQLAEFKKDLRGLAPAAVNEMLRYNTASALNCRRVATGDLTLHGQSITKGEGVICAVQAGDRDELATPDPDKFDIHRKYPAHEVLGFGYGIHRCQAETLSRVQLEVTFASLFERFPNLKLGADFETLDFGPKNQNIGISALPVKI
ncbi:cytochrome P450 55A1 [Xylariales sp. PMI_506]|nr:cytochrome P450 55A1 [Xylariales sp. PMI_506]